MGHGLWCHRAMGHSLEGRVLLSGLFVTTPSQGKAPSHSNLDIFTGLWADEAKAGQEIHVSPRVETTVERVSSGAFNGDGEFIIHPNDDWEILKGQYEGGTGRQAITISS